MLATPSSASLQIDVRASVTLCPKQALHFRIPNLMNTKVHNCWNKMPVIAVQVIHTCDLASAILTLHNPEDECNICRNLC
jgi:hypothetical protein